MTSRNHVKLDLHRNVKVTYVERNAIAQLYMKHKLYVSGCRSTSHTTFEVMPLENTLGHDNNDANSVGERITARNATICHVILQMT
ncbi:hypothetical protein HanHA300_Chr16g0604421 [Helianthus annuus]|nr:hypothetical protein HanHA300_Chr16g0604421 [Helianthus annuus]KAJ0459952.1 hypothetical protein HanHA89_Chr16g0654941 [Helianthus annuus]